MTEAKTWAMVCHRHGCGALGETSKPCLAFKVLAAGRRCDRQETVEQAFEATFRHIKGNDAVIVGIYPEYEDQVQRETEYVHRDAPLSGSSGLSRSA